MQANRIVRSVCANAVLRRSRRGLARRIPVPRWEIEVLPPDEAAFSSGARAYRCIARLASGAYLRRSAVGR